MLKKRRMLLWIILGLLLITGCGVAPVRQETALPSQDLDQPLSDPSSIRLIMYNNSNKLWFGLDGSGEVNITMDGKGVCRLGVGEYVIVETTPGRHKFDLAHQDLGTFTSSYTITLTEKEIYMQVFATPASNVAEKTPKPESFKERYKPVK